MVAAATIEDMKAIERLLDAIPAKKMAELESLPAVANLLDKKWLPNPGPQTDAYYCEADELFFGGEAGGGKSDILMGLALTQHDQSLLLRRTNKEASKFIKRFAQIVGHRDGWNGQLGTFSFPNGRVVEMGGCQYEEDKEKYKGDPHDLIGFDEIADFAETQYRFIIGWNRSVKKGQRRRVVCTGNPPTRPEGLWVVKYWGAWLDPTHPNPAKEGELRWYTTIDGEDREVDGPGPHVIPGEPKPVIARSRTFIRSQLEDNPDLEESGYDAVLAALPEGLRRAYREGQFSAYLKDEDFQVIPTQWILAAQERWKADGGKGLVMSAIGLDCAGGGEDPAALVPRHGEWFGQIQTVKGSDTADGVIMLGHVIAMRRDACPVIVDVGGGYAGAVIERFKDNGVTYSKFDGSSAARGTALSINLQFANRRSEAWWRLREALDPEMEWREESPIALPPDSELRAELAAPTYEVRNGKIYVESKDKIKDKIGRSTNKGDAVAMALSEGNKVTVQRQGLGGSQPKVVLGYASSKRRRK